MTERFPDKHHPDASFAEVTGFIKSAQELSGRMEVEQPVATWRMIGEYPQAPHSFTFMTDIHYGSLGVDYDLLQQHTNIITQTPNMFAIVGGDIVDNFGIKHAHAGILGDAIPPQAQTDTMIEWLADLDRKGKLGAVQLGNHDDWLELSGYKFEQFLRELMCPVYAAAGDLHIEVGEAMRHYLVWWGHTHWGNSKINPTNAPKRALEYSNKDADIALVGHTHVASGEVFDRAGKRQIAVVGGTYKLGDKMGRKWGLGVAGSPGYTIVLWPNEQRMELFRDPMTARSFILGDIRTSLDQHLWEDPYTASKRK